MTRDYWFFVGLAVLAAPLSAAAQDMRPAMIPAEGTILDVSATGSSMRTPDIATIEAGVVTTAPTATEAMRQNAERMTAMLTALRKAGIADRDVQTATVSLNPQYRDQPNEAPVIAGYQASNQVSIRFRDIARSGAILDTLVSEGANNLQGPSLTIEKPEAAMDAARRDAIAKARARAVLYAEAAGLKVDRILSISEGGDAMPPIAGFVRLHANASSPTPIMAGEQQVSASVSVRFLLK